MTYIINLIAKENNIDNFAIRIYDELINKDYNVVFLQDYKRTYEYLNTNINVNSIFNTQVQIFDSIIEIKQPDFIIFTGSLLNLLEDIPNSKFNLQIIEKYSSYKNVLLHMHDAELSKYSPHTGLEIGYDLLSDSIDGLQMIIKYILLHKKNYDLACFTCGVTLNQYNKIVCEGCYDEWICSKCYHQDILCEYCLKTSKKIDKYNRCQNPKCNKMTSVDNCKQVIDDYNVSNMCTDCVGKQGLGSCMVCDNYLSYSKLIQCISVPKCNNRICNQCFTKSEPYICDDCSESTCQICFSRGTSNKHDIQRLFLCEGCNLEVCLQCSSIVYCQSVYCYCFKCAKTFTYKCSNKQCMWSSSGSDYYSECGTICLDSGEDYCPTCNKGIVKIKSK